LNEADADKNIENAEATDDAAKRRVEEKQAQRLGQMNKKIVLFPEIGPGEIEEEGAHLQA